MRQALPLLLVVAALVHAGCTQPYAKDSDGDPEGDGGDGASSCTPGVDGCPCPVDMRNVEGGGCAPVDSIILDIQMSGDGGYEVGVPFPHGAWCLTGDDWLDGMQETRKLDAHSTRDVDRGKVLWLQGRDDSQYLSRVDLSNRTECQTLRDPWSIDPDPAEGTIEVTSDEAVTFAVYYRLARGNCTELRQYSGEASGGWTTLPQTFEGGGC